MKHRHLSLGKRRNRLNRAREGDSMSTLDLNRLREIVLESQNGTPVPNNPKQQLLVDREGRIQIGDHEGNPAKPLSRIQQDTFASPALAECGL
jgi:hypothetical protein